MTDDLAFFAGDLEERGYPRAATWQQGNYRHRAAAIARARAMRALGLPHQWAPNTRASRRRLARLLLDTFPPGTITGL